MKIILFFINKIKDDKGLIYKKKSISFSLLN